MTVPGAERRVRPYFIQPFAILGDRGGELFADSSSNAATNQAATRLWQAVHFFEVGGVTSVLVFTISSWQPAQLRW
jgi:hypothetical protein